MASGLSAVALFSMPSCGLGERVPQGDRVSGNIGRDATSEHPRCARGMEWKGRRLNIDAGARRAESGETRNAIEGMKEEGEKESQRAGLFRPCEVCVCGWA